MLTLRPFRSGRKPSRPRPVPELGSIEESPALGPPIALILRSVVILVVVIVGVVASGAFVSTVVSANKGKPIKYVPHILAPGSFSANVAPTQSSQIPSSTTTPTTSPPPPVPSAQSTAPAAPQPSNLTSTTSPFGSTIRASGTHLVLNGSTYQFTGVNAYQIATYWGANSGCGQEASDAQLNQLFGGLRPNSLVRIWAFQGTMATDVSTGQLNWAPLDRVFAAAVAHGQRLIVTISGQSGGCDGGHWQDPSWFDGGFENVYNSPSDSNGMALDPVSYWTYMQALVSRYKNSPALGMWEPFSEPEPSTCPAAYEPSTCSGHTTCPNEAVAAQSLRYFFDTVGGEIHALDPNHLVEDGTIGSGQCGTQGSDFTYVSSSPGIDVMSYHDYSDPSVSAFAQQWNGTLAWDFAQASLIGKPIIGGEMGIEASDAGCSMNLAQRSADIQAKLQAQLANGSSGALLWGWVPVTDVPCNYEIAPGDPVLGVIDSVPLQN